MNKQKGFTIIELIVVIAIIAVLAAIVLVNVTQYISKAKDVAIKSDIANIALGMSACFGETSTYVGCFVPTTGTTYIPATLESDINTQNGGAGGVPTVNMHATAGTYCASAELATSTDDNAYICVDSTGVTKSSATSTCGELYACPN